VVGRKAPLFAVDADETDEGAKKYTGKWRAVGTLIID